MRSVLVLPSLLPIPFIFDAPNMKTFPYLFTRVVDSPMHDACFMFGRSIFVGFTSVRVCLEVSDIPIFLKELLTLFKPHR